MFSRKYWFELGSCDPLVVLLVVYSFMFLWCIIVLQLGSVHFFALLKLPRFVLEFVPSRVVWGVLLCLDV